MTEHDGLLVGIVAHSHAVEQSLRQEGPHKVNDCMPSQGEMQMKLLALAPRPAERRKYTVRSMFCTTAKQIC